MTNTEKYNEHHRKSLEDLSLNLSGAPLNSPDALLMRIVYEQKTMEKQAEFNKTQIELQHNFNKELLKKQLEANRKFLYITVTATILAAILGAAVGGYAQYAIPKYFQKPTEQKPQEITRHHTENTTSASRPEKSTDKAPFVPPLK